MQVIIMGGTKERKKLYIDELFYITHYVNIRTEQVPINITFGGNSERQVETHVGKKSILFVFPSFLLHKFKMGVSFSFPPRINRN